MASFEILAIGSSPYMVQSSGAKKEGFSSFDESIAAAASQAGYVGIVDLAFAKLPATIDQLLIHSIKHNRGIRLSFDQIEEFSERAQHACEKLPNKNISMTMVIVPDRYNRGDQLKDKTTAQLINQLKFLNLNGKDKKVNIRILVETISAREAVLANNLSIDGIVAKGQEASGIVGETTAFVLMQECLSRTKLPVFVWGGIGLHTAAACYAAGAAGVVLDSQLVLTKESLLPIVLKAKVEQFDGTELHLLPLANNLADQENKNQENKNEESKLNLRVYARAFHNITADNALSGYLTGSVSQNKNKTLTLVYEEIGSHNIKNESYDWILPLGQDAAFAGGLTQKYLSVAGILQAIEKSVAEHIALCHKLKPLAPASQLAQSHGTKYPIVQGAMTRVSDKAEFANEVAEAGGLPFLALALMRGAEANVLINEAKNLLKDKPWGIGILGFVPNELRQEQMAVLEKYKPPYVLIAGGRPDQAKHLENMGIKTYLHVPSPLLLDSFMEMGSKRFIFEGKECGGHIGPRSSFILWETMIEHLLDNIGSRENASAYHVIFAGGIHDDKSAAAVAALASPLAARGVRIGVLMGTAYLFTEEVVNSGAIIKKFQEAAITCEQTVLLETGPGHAIRCINSPYKKAFDKRRQTLAQAGVSKEEVREELELMNLGRLRLASKGLIRKDSLTELNTTSENNFSVSSKEKAIAELMQSDSKPNSDSNSKSNNLEQAPEDAQWQHGMYMIGQVASLHKNTCTIDNLHENVSLGGTQLIEALSNDIAEEKIKSPSKFRSTKEGREAIAIIGMSCLLPKAKNVEAFWANILNKVDTIEEVPLYQWDWRNYYDPNPLAPDKIYSKWGGFLEDIEFDPTKYGIPPSSLGSIDPMQILLLEVTDAALKDAGYDKKPFPRERTSVILANAGHGPITAMYSLRSMLGWKLAHVDPALKQELENMLPEWTEDSFPGYLGNVTAGRVANRFDLGGVNFSIDAACASSLAALYSGVTELRNGNSDVVFLASTDTHNQPGDYLSFSKTHAFSADGHCKTFDASADGIVISEGIAMLVLKRLSDAERDGDKIYAVIKGIGGSSDGRDLSLTAPRPAGQIKALNRAYEDAGIDPSTVTLIEAHGTGTVAGDKAEVEALKQVFENSKAKPHSCAIGSVKTMIGHTKATAGLASIIKVAKALHHKILPPTIGVKNPNPACHFENGPFYINAESRPWIMSSQSSAAINNKQSVLSESNHLNSTNDVCDSQTLRRAGVSAFGFGGTNFHTVLEEYIPDLASLKTIEESPVMPAELFVFRGSSIAEITRAIATCADKAKKYIDSFVLPELSLATLAYQQFLKDHEHHAQTNKVNQLGRSTKTETADQASEQPKRYCLSIVASSLTDLIEKIGRAKEAIQIDNKEQFKDPRGIYFQTKSINDSTKLDKLAFLFPGQGSQYPAMLSDLAVRYSEVQQTFAEANNALYGQLDKSLSEYIFPPPVFSKEEELACKEAITDTRIAQPAMGAANMAAKALLDSFAIKPDMVAGHSYGEYVALCTAEYFDFNSLMHISKQRGEILAQPNDGKVFTGTMAAVSCSASELEKQLQYLPSTISIANLNSPGQTVIAGGLDDIDKAISVLQSNGFTARRIPVSQAFHTESMKESAEQLATVLENISLASGNTDVYSNLNGQKYDRSATNIASNLKAHTVKPVDFVSQIKNMYSDGARIFLEVGPGSVLTNLTQSILENTDAVCIAIDRQGRDGTINLLHALAQMIVCGVDIDLQRLYQNRFSVLKQVSLFDQSTSSKKLVYLVNSANVRLKGQAPAAAIAKSKALTNTNTSRSFSPSNITLNANILDEGFGNSNMGNTSGNISTKKTSLRINDVAKSPLTSSEHLVNASNNHSSEVNEIMMQFQETMQQMANSFLETQQRVMLAYLSNQNIPEQNLIEHNLDSGTQETQSNQLIGNAYRQDEATARASNEMISSTESLVTVQVAQPEPTPQAELSTDQLVNTLLEIVAERTGYPVDMIDPNLDLEADLGIDSIKRVEILNKFRRVLPEAKQKQLESGIEELAGAKTLQSIIDWLRASENSVCSLPDNNGSHGSAESELSITNITYAEPNGGNGKHDNARTLSIADSAQVKSNGNSSIVKRGIVSPAALPVQNLTDKELSEQLQKIKQEGSLVLITADTVNLANALGEQLAIYGFIPVVLRHSLDQAISNNGQTENLSTPLKTGNVLHYDLNLEDFELVQTTLLAFQAKYGAASMILHLQSFAQPEPGINKTSAITLLHLLKHFAGAYEKAKTKLVTVTSMGGKFGHEIANINFGYSPVQAAVVGLTKVAAKELPNFACKVVDFDLEAETAKEIDTNKLKNIVSKILNESVSDDNNIEVGYQSEQRWGLDIIDGSLKADFSQAPLDEKSVVLVTGGARGITAEIAMHISKLYRPIMILIGRSTLPIESEDPRFMGLEGIRELKAKIIDTLKADGQPVNIPEVESRYQTLIKEREIRNNIDSLKSSASHVEYNSLDVRDDKSLTKLIENIYKKHGKIDAVIHGAGVIEDALLKDKEKESFERVFDTKVKSALTLVDSLKLDSLKYFFLFSSVVGRTGNAGQSDYVAANEVLNKLALSIKGKLLTGRVASIMWGPWKGGMAQPELESIFAQYGWAMIDTQKGSEAFINEMFCTSKKDSEVLLVAESATKQKIKGARLAHSEVFTNASGDKEYIVELDTQVDTFLQDHAFDGVPVLPMAYALELMCEAAQATYPNLNLNQIKSLDIPAGILFDVPKKKISILVHEEQKQSDSTIATVTIVSGVKTRRANFKAQFFLSNQIKVESPKALPKIFSTNGHDSHHNNGNGDKHMHSESKLDLTQTDLGTPITLPPISDIYRQWLFHGQSFHGMKNIYMAGEQGVIGQVAGLSAENCLRLEKGDDWIIDPVMFDCAMQLGGIWARKCLDITALPTGFKRLQFFSPQPPAAEERIFVHIIVCPDSSKNELRCDMALYNQTGELFMYVEELSGVGSKSLHRLASQNMTIEAGVSG